MRESDRCGLPYVRFGDIRECRLPANHEGDCPDANRAASIADLTQHRHDWVF